LEQSASTPGSTLTSCSPARNAAKSTCARARAPALSARHAGCARGRREAARGARGRELGALLERMLDPADREREVGVGGEGEAPVPAPSKGRGDAREAVAVAREEGRRLAGPHPRRPPHRQRRAARRLCGRRVGGRGARSGSGAFAAADRVACLRGVRARRLATLPSRARARASPRALGCLCRSPTPAVGHSARAATAHRACPRPERKAERARRVRALARPRHSPPARARAYAHARAHARAGGAPSSLLGRNARRLCGLTQRAIGGHAASCARCARWRLGRGGEPIRAGDGRGGSEECGDG
jgi:hypothetical protein